MPETAIPIGLPPEEAIEHFRRKGMRESFDWRDVMHEEHAKAFTVAKATRMDLLEDIRGAVDRAIAEGTTLADFQRELTPTLQRKGWWGRQAMRDPVTGDVKDVQLGSARRLETIYDTNLRTSMAAGKWEQIQRTTARRPYLRYVHLDSAHPRPQHAAWHGLVLPVDDEFWKQHYPPNGWHCKCSVQQLSDRDLARYGYTVGTSPPIEHREWENPRTGERHRVPRGVDPGFAYYVGAASETQAKVFVNKIAAVSSDLGAAVWTEAAPQLIAPLDRGYAKWADAVLGSGRYDNSLWGVGGLSPDTVGFLRARGHEPASAAITLTDRALLHAERDAKQQRGGAVPRAVLAHLPAHIAAPRAILWDRTDPALIYVLDVAGQIAKVVVRVNYAVKGKVLDVGRVTMTTNSVRTAGVVETSDLAIARYEIVEGAL